MGRHEVDIWRLSSFFTSTALKGAQIVLWMKQLEAMNSAAESGHLNVVKFLHENRREGCTETLSERAIERAAGGGYLPIR
ncbi:hypothetical protein PHMEG_00026734 [Phytophthora megakarya]|uniref:Uncharacterized protein n=1 Tax=Phytophthora megakarya TaxID=4795 RepID=A0A225V9P9_9STRA|nr:hypothetical protein PHMEG_00026734 [Phytophthora megakarya]